MKQSINPLIENLIKVKTKATYNVSVSLLANEVLEADLTIKDVDNDGDTDINATVRIAGKVVFSGTVDLGEIDLADADSILEALVGIAEKATGLDVPGLGPK